jgi:hypothetical protein
MKTSSHNQAGRGCEEISQTEKDFTEREVFSHLQKALRNLILRGGFSRGEIAEVLNVQPSQVSMWLSHSDERRRITIDKAKDLLRLVKPQPRLILGDIEAAENAIALLVEKEFGPGRDPNRF